VPGEVVPPTAAADWLSDREGLRTSDGPLFLIGHFFFLIASCYRKEPPVSYLRRAPSFFPLFFKPTFFPPPSFLYPFFERDDRCVVLCTCSIFPPRPRPYFHYFRSPTYLYTFPFRVLPQFPRALTTHICVSIPVASAFLF